jgi:hypothetical protein
MMTTKQAPMFFASQVLGLWIAFALEFVNGDEQRWNCKGACKACGAKTSLLGRLVRGKTARQPNGSTFAQAVQTADGRLYHYENGRVFVPCRGCGKTRFAAALDGKVDMSKVCNAKCMGACGPACECSCGGKNHGSSFSL